MLIKEYRIPLPLTVEEYRIAQLYMIQKKSREESSGAGSAVEIICNEPYVDGPGGAGQYTYKIYHIGNHLPGWFRSILPKSALRVEEEAWNAYPYTKTIFRCPFVEKFCITIETVYHPDGGTQQNVFNLKQNELNHRIVDVLDFVKDKLPVADYKLEEDPLLYHSSVTRRGPLSADWLKERAGGGLHAAPIMCAYKLCYVEFKYWGMQSKIEKFIHDTALRKTMLRAHRQAWAWQDEWFGLTMNDIRNLEKTTQQVLAHKMKAVHGDEMTSDDSLLNDSGNGLPGSAVPPSDETQDGLDLSPLSPSGRRHSSWEKSSHSSQSAMMRSMSDSKQSWVSLEYSPDSDQEEFFDAKDEFEASGLLQPQCLQRSSSIDCMDEQLDAKMNLSLPNSGNSSRCCSPQPVGLREQGISRETDNNCKITTLFIVLHGGNALMVESDKSSKMSDISTIKATFDKVVQQHYSAFISRFAIRMVSCPPIHSDALGLLASINPFSNECSDPSGQIRSLSFPISAVPILASCSAEYTDALTTVSNRANKVYRDFLLSDDGHGFNGQVVFITDCMGSMMAFDILCSSSADLMANMAAESLSKKFSSETNLRAHEDKEATFSAPFHGGDSRMLSHQTKPSSASLLHQSAQMLETRGFLFDVSDMFMFGSPLALVLAQRIVSHGPDCLVRPNCFQVYNLFHSTDPCAGRLEPLLESSFAKIETVKVPRYQRFPMGDGQSMSLLDCLQRHGMLTETYCPSVPRLTRQGSTSSYLSAGSSDLQLEGVAAGSVLSSVSSEQVTRKWWGNKRVDYTLYCPEALESFPAHSLPHLFHGSFWESMDVVSFILRQLLLQQEDMDQLQLEVHQFKHNQPREKWLNKRTSMKTKNITPNHRGNDVIVLEDMPQVLTARFMYGTLDISTLSGERVDIHVITDHESCDWQYFGTSVTDKYGRASFIVPKEKQLSLGLYPVKMVVRGDHTFADLSLLVLPSGSPVVVFSIDGSFTASVSIMGKDPKVRPGAVDVVRFWQDLGFLILYISARPDMQLRKVVSWLAQHNFPHGMVVFMDGLSADPLRQKASYLKSLVQEASIDIRAAYGSHKDITVYQSVGLTMERIYIVGKAPKKASSLAQILVDGYAAHLLDLQSNSKVMPCSGNARLYIQKSSFSLRGQKYKTSTKRKTLLTGGEKTPAISVHVCGNTMVDAGGVGGDTMLGRLRGHAPKHMRPPGLLLSEHSS